MSTWPVTNCGGQKLFVLSLQQDKMSRLLFLGDEHRITLICRICSSVFLFIGIVKCLHFIPLFDISILNVHFQFNSNDFTLTLIQSTH